MALPRRIGADFCELAGQWTLDLELARKLVELNVWATATFDHAGLRWPGLWIISGQRTALGNERAGGASGSLHILCPSRAVDLRVGNVGADITTRAMWTWLGTQWKLLGGRWGGDFRDGAGTLRTDELNHFDIGPPLSNPG